jgi:SNF2 family DNA or RNA helicase
MSVDTINIDFDPARQRLVLKGGFMFVDVMRSFPSRRFDPKTKAWHVPLVKSNAKHLEHLHGRVSMTLTDAAKDAIGDLERLSQGPIYKPFPRPWFEGRREQPMEHQWPMLDRGWALKAYALFATMGTGKTFVTVNMAMARFEAMEIMRVVIICPQTLRRTWRREFNQFADKKKFTILDHATSNVKRWNKTSPSVYEKWIASDPEKLHILLVGVEGLGISDKYYDSMLPFVTDNKYVMGVCDESSRIKNPEATRTKRCIDIAAMCKFKMILNGTPIALGLHDLWSQYQFLDPNIIGSGDYWAFKSRYVVMGGYEDRQIIGYANTEELMGCVRPYTIEVGKDVLSLPPKLYKTITVEASVDQTRLFEKIVSGIGEGAAISVKNVLERMLRLQQVVGGFEPETDEETQKTTCRPLFANPKMDALLGVIEDHLVGSKFIIWVRYIPEIELIKETLIKKYGRASVVDYYGETTPEERAEAERRYNGDPTCRFLIGNPAAAGLGLTLISGETDIMVYYSGTFAYIDRAQSEDRSHRIGQRNVVTIVDLVIEKSIDEAIQGSIAAKTDMSEWVKRQLDSGKSVAEIIG